MNSQLYQFVVRKGPRPGQIFPLELDLLTIGRDPLSDIVIEDPEVSRHHARLTQSAGGYLLQDRGSTNGSFVDGVRLTGEPVLLNPGQVIMFGSTVTLVYQALPDSDPMATMVAPSVPEVPEEPEALEEAEVFEEPELVEESVAPPVADVVIDEPEPIEESVPEPLFEEMEVEIEEPLVLHEVEIAEPDLEEVEEVVPEPLLADILEEAVIEEPLEVPDSQPIFEEEGDEDDEMATMVEPIPFEVPDEPVIPEKAQVVDDDEAEAPILPVFDELEPEPPLMPVFEESEPEPPAMPVFEESEPEAPALPVFEEAEPEIELPSEPPPLAPLPAFEEQLPVPEPEPVMDSPSFGYEDEKVTAATDSGAPLMDFDVPTTDKPVVQTDGEIVDETGDDNRNRNIIIGVAAFVALCCLCLVTATALYFFVFAA